MSINHLTRIGVSTDYLSYVNFYRIYILLSDYCFDEVWVQPRATSYDEKSIRCLVKIIDD